MQRSPHLIRILMIIGVIILFIATIGVFLFNKQSKDTPDTTIGANVALNVRRVFIKDLHEYYQNNSHNHADGSIENTLYTYASNGISDLYTGYVRPNSFKKIDSRTSRLLIDIEPAQITYAITFLGTTKEKLTPISIKCALKDEQMNIERNCHDGGMP